MPNRTSVLITGVSRGPATCSCSSEVNDFNSGGAVTGFVFDLAGIDAVLKRWRALREELREDEKVAQPLHQVVGPGEEPASWGVADNAASAGKSFLHHHQEMCEVVARYIDALTASRNAYLAAEQANTDAMERK